MVSDAGGPPVFSDASSWLDDDKVPERKDAFVTLGGTQVRASTINVAILGSGNFGTAMGVLLAGKGVNVTIVVRKPEVADAINREHVNPKSLGGLELPHNIGACIDPAAAFCSADFIFHAVPCQFSRDTLGKVKGMMPPDVPVICMTKGIETGTLQMMSEVMTDVLGPDRPLAYLSGPSFAMEIAQGLATAVTIASTDRDLGYDVMSMLKTRHFRGLYTSDVIGVEVCGAIKNVIAIAAGMCEGLGLGTNAMAALVTRGCSEMRRLTQVMGGEDYTVFGLSGVGDTFGTCFGPLSRNRMVGKRLGSGESLEDILGSTDEVAEGVATSRAIAQLLEQRVRGYRRDLKFPILLGVAAILDGKLTPRQGLEKLMQYPLRVEDFDAPKRATDPLLLADKPSKVSKPALGLGQS